MGDGGFDVGNTPGQGARGGFFFGVVVALMGHQGEEGLGLSGARHGAGREAGIVIAIKFALGKEDIVAQSAIGEFATIAEAIGELDLIANGEIAPLDLLIGIGTIQPKTVQNFNMLKIIGVTGDHPGVDGKLPRPFD